jgi:hypothetical protein
MHTPRLAPLKRSAAARTTSSDHFSSLHMRLHSISCRRRLW